jgi:hypothetical protein
MEMKQTWLILTLVLTGCSSVTPIPTEPVVIDYGKGCSVTVYQTEADALKRGPIVEMCVIEGTSSMSFKHTTETAIQKHAKKACECGANQVYVQARQPMSGGVASVSMVAFKWPD